jgi:hypothetical protein
LAALHFRFSTFEIKTAMELAAVRTAWPSIVRGRAFGTLRPIAAALLAQYPGCTTPQQRQLHATTRRLAASNAPYGIPPNGMPSYFSVARPPALPSSATVIKFVPQQTAWVVERMGKFHRILPPGFAILIPFIDRIAYVKSLKEATFDIPSQSAITADNVTLELDGVLYTRVFDPYKAR